MKYFYIILLVALTFPFSPQAQNMYKGDIVFKRVQSTKIRDKIAIEFTINLKQVKMNSQLMLTLTPIIRSYDNANIYMFDPIIIAGKARDKALNRALSFGDFQFDVEPRIKIRHHNDRLEEVNVQLELPYAPWVRHSRLIVHEVVSGCGACEIAQNEYEVIDQTLAPLYTPDYQVSLIYPPIEPVKRRSDTYVAHLDFVVGKSELRYDFRNNASMLKRVDDFFSEIMSDPNLSVGTCSVQGFASPDGNYSSNMELSEDRVYAFVNFLKNKYNIPSDKFQVKWFGEDWEGLLNLMEPLFFRNKAEAINIVRFESDITLRKARLKALSGGSTYRYLLREVFPALRRSEYTINYIARPFNIVEAKAVINQKPCHLSLNEMYLVAHTYEKGSDAFNEVFQIAVDAFPEAPIARINAGAVGITQQKYDVAIGHLLFIDQAEAWNNLAIAYSYVRNYEYAAKYFERAIEAGCKEAEHNLQELRKLLDDYLY